MIDKCSNGQTCRSEGEDRANELFPYFYLDNGFIYYNKECGKCFGETKLIPWRVGFICKDASSDSHVDDYASGVESLLNDNQDCVLRFLGKIDVTTHMCYPKSKIIRDCISNDKSDQLTQDNYTKCNKFNATYHVVRPFDEKVYAKVYCALCNNENWIKLKDCKFESESVKAPSDSVFLFLDSVEDTNITGLEKRKTFCREVTSNL